MVNTKLFKPWFLLKDAMTKYNYKEKAGKQQCPECDGQKFVTEQDYWDNHHCPVCKGEGFI